ncbi:MAG: 4Fe-4S binding protein [bacterium]
MKNKIRVILQFIFLALVVYVGVRPLFDSSYAQDFEAYCPFGGISSFFSKLELGTMSCQMSTVQVALGFGLILGVLLLGKLFCSYICPLGTIMEWIGKLGEKLKLRFDIPKVVDRPLRILKYVLLFITVYFTMTMSELFCKQYDPYFALVNLFKNPDITLVYAIIAVAITLLGSFFFRMFWCKYLCPLGAVSNIFLNVYGAGGVIIVFVLLKLFGVNLSYVYLLAGLVLVGLITEVGFKKGFFLPFFKIHRHNDTCSKCGICEANCPQGIDLTKFDVIDDIDCNLCCDCVHSCPTKNSVTIGKTKTTKYIAPIATIVLIGLSLWYGSTFEFSTISERWGGFDQVKNVQTFRMENLKTVKCYGSAMSLMNQINNIPGIVGLDAYASSHTVEIYYDPSKISAEKVKEAIFTPAKQEVNKIKKNMTDSISVCEIAVNGLFDNLDYINLSWALKKDAGVYGYETHFGEPVNAVIYFNDKISSLYQIEKLIKAKTVKIKTKQGFEIREIEFEVMNAEMQAGKINVAEYNKRMFKSYDKAFNKYKTYKSEDLSVLVFPMPEAASPLAKRQLSYLMSHLSNDSGIVRFATNYTTEIFAYVFFNAKLTTVEKVIEAIKNPKITITFTGGKKEIVDNPFELNPEGEIKSAKELDLPDILK